MPSTAKTVPDGIHTMWPIITEDDKKQVMESLESRILTGPYGPQLRGAETEFAQWVGAKHCLMTNSGTAALHMAVEAAQVGPGDEVILPSFTFLATALAVLHNNAVPVFVDIDPDTFNIDPSKIKAKITPRTKAVIAVHLHGLCADIDPIKEICARHNLLLIEDAAQAHGATYKGRKAGTLGDMAIFSVQASKNLPCGEGGFFVTSNDALADRANKMRLFGQDASFEDEKLINLNWPIDRFRGFESIMGGWQYLPGELPAALTRSQLRALDAHNENARRNGRFLTEQLKDVPGLIPPRIPADRETVYHKFRLRLDPAAAGVDAPPAVFRDKVLAALQAEGVECCLWETKPLPLQKYFAEQTGYGRGCPYNCAHRSEPAPKPQPEDYANAKSLLDSSLVLGSHSYPIIAQSIEVMEYYVKAIKKVFSGVKNLF
jgi:dTDP-4-amino-4,6-dideoxygalactose transaminase